jgi:triosephosphate isomerase (TIM)
MSQSSPIISQKTTSKLCFFNWKMNPSNLCDAQKLIQGYNKIGFDPLVTTVFVPNVYLHLCSDSNFMLGAQDVSQYSTGAYTGQVSVGMLKDMGCKYVLAGHSEIRKHHSINNKGVKVKVDRTWEAGLIPVLCIAYSNDLFKHNQLKLALDSVLDNSNLIEREIVIAFEPLSNIGSGKAMETSQIKEYIDYIKKVVETKHNISAKILYGGSVNSGNIKDLKSIDGLDGFLIGKASLDLVEVNKIVSY